MTDISAAYGQWQLKKVNTWHKRKILSKYYHQGLKDLDGIIYEPKILTLIIMPITSLSSAWLHLNGRSIGMS